MFRKTDKRPLLLLFLYFLALLLPAGSMPLMESTEARYAEIAREMIVSGNYVEPFFNGIKHFHKPPFAYWMVAAGFHLFGMNDFGARFFGIVAAVLAVLYLFRLARLLFGEEKRALWAAVMFASAVLMLVVSRLASTEIYLVCFTVIAQFYLFRQLYGERRMKNALFYGLFLGLGFMTKGPIILLFTLLPFLLAKTFDREHRRVFSWPQTAAATLLFALVAFPWYLLVAAENPGLLHYFLKVQVVDRAVTNRFHRYEPAWYFFYVFFASFFPYCLFFVKGVGNWRSLAPRLKILFFYIAVPFVIFTLVQGKHATYILPFYGLAAVIAAEAFARFPMPRLRLAALAVLAPVAPALAGAGFFYRPLAGKQVPLVVAGLLAGVLLWQAWRCRRRPAFLSWIAVFFLFLITVGIWGTGVAGPQMRGYERMAAALNRLDPGRHLEVLVYRGFLPSLSFYRGRLAVMAFGETRNTQFQHNQNYRRYYVRTEEALRSFLATKKALFVVARHGHIEPFTRDYPYACEPLFVQHRHTAFLCRRLPAAASSHQKIRPPRG